MSNCMLRKKYLNIPTVHSKYLVNDSSVPKSKENSIKNYKGYFLRTILQLVYSPFT